MEHIPEVPSTPVRLMKERFVEVKKLGAGNFGDAFLVMDKKYNNAHRVVKRLHKSIQQMNPKTLAESRAEIANLSRVSHHHVVRLFRAWFDVDQHLHMLMEYCESGDLEDFVKQRFPLPEVLVRSLFMQLLAGMDEIHHGHLLHRDIKAKNIFMTRVYVGHPKSPDPQARAAAAEVGRHVDPRVVPHLATDSKGFAIVLKIGDFGLSKALNYTEDKAKTVAGTPFHFSPELARNQPYTRRTDIWSLGVLFYFILTLSMPFRGKTIQEVFCSILREKVPHPASRFQDLYNRPIPYSNDLIEIVLDMLNKTESLRPTTEDILARRYFSASSAGVIPPSAASQQQKAASGGGGNANNANGPSTPLSPQQQQQQQQQPSTARKGSATPPPPSTPPPPTAAYPQQQQQQQQAPTTHRMCVARSDALINIRARPSLRAGIVGTLRYKDEIAVVRAVEVSSAEEEGGGGGGGGGGASPLPIPTPTAAGAGAAPTPLAMWWQISSPCAGFCISAHNGKDLFVLKHSGSDHPTPRLSPLRGGDGGGGHARGAQNPNTNNNNNNNAAKVNNNNANHNNYDDDGNDDDIAGDGSSYGYGDEDRLNITGRRPQSHQQQQQQQKRRAVIIGEDGDVYEEGGQKMRGGEGEGGAWCEHDESDYDYDEYDNDDGPTGMCGGEEERSAANNNNKGKNSRNKMRITRAVDEGYGADDMMFSFSDACPPPPTCTPSAPRGGRQQHQKASNNNNNRGGDDEDYDDDDDESSDDDGIVIVDPAKEKMKKEREREAAAAAAREEKERSRERKREEEAAAAAKEERRRLRQQQQQQQIGSAAAVIPPPAPPSSQPIIMRRPSSPIKQQPSSAKANMGPSAPPPPPPRKASPLAAGNGRQAPPSHYQQQHLQNQNAAANYNTNSAPNYNNGNTTTNTTTSTATTYNTSNNANTNTNNLMPSGGGGHISPVRHRKSPQVVLPPLGAPASARGGATTSPVKMYRSDGVKRG